MVDQEESPDESLEAIRWDGSEASQAAIVNWAGGVISGWCDSEYFLKIREPGVVLRVNSGDWVICANGRYLPCSPDVFEETYEPASNQQETHYERAEVLLKRRGNAEALPFVYAELQAQASLAVAEALQGIWHELEELNVRLTNA